MENTRKYLDYDGLKYFNNIIQRQLDDKVDKVEGKDLSTNDFTNVEKDKLSGIEIGATKTIVDTELNDTSTNPVQNKVISEILKTNSNKLQSFMTIAQMAKATAETADGKASTALSVLDNKIDKAEGKGLSTNDYTDIDKGKLDKFSDADNYALKSDIVNIYKFKGSVASYEDLPDSGNIVGDVYNTEDTGMNYAWVGDNTWDALGGTISFEYITNSDIDIMFE